MSIRGVDTYKDFEQLAANEILNTDYRILVRDVGSDITIAAPHGGCIEPNTSPIANKIAGSNYNCYCFEGIKPKNNLDLHITSHQFDEPQAIDLISKSNIIITIHACTEKTQIIYLGGLFKEFIDHIRETLKTYRIRASNPKAIFPGVHRDNICNRGKFKKGVQLEISRGLRDEPDKIELISKAVRNALKTFIY